VVLHRCDRHDLACALDLLDADLGQADVPNLAGVPVFLDRGEACLERRLGIDSMQVVERDAVCARPAEALVNLRP
jgi:hypothetical protein